MSIRVHVRELRLVLLPLFAAACIKVGPELAPPAAEVPSSWLEGKEQGVETGPVNYRDWWRVFSDPVLDRLIARALESNLPLQVAGVRVLEARAELGIAVGELYPQTQQATGLIEYSRLSGRLGSGQGGLGAPGTVGPGAVGAGGLGTSGGTGLGFFAPTGFLLADLAIQASWELDLWGKYRRGVQSASASWLATIADYDSALVSLTANVATTYILTRTLEKRIEIARENVKAERDSLGIAKARYRYGTVSELDVAQARTVLESTLATIPPLELQLQQAKNALSVLLGLPPGELSDLLPGPAAIPASPAYVVVGIPADLLRQRPDVRSAEYQAAAQCAQIGVAKADLLPSFSLLGTFGFLSTTLGTSSLAGIFRWSSRSIQGGSFFQWNILNYGRITNNVRVQDARFQELLIDYQNTVLEALREVEDGLVGFWRSHEQARRLAGAVTVARRAVDLAIRQYEQGTVDYTTVITTQLSLFSAQDSLASALGAIATNLVSVYRALGGGWQLREGKALVPAAVAEQMDRRTNWGDLLAPAAYNPPPAKRSRSLIRLPDW